MIVIIKGLNFQYSGGLGDLGLGGGPSQPPQQSQQPSFQDPFGAPASAPAAAPSAEQSLPVLLSADKAKGLTLRGQIARMDGRIGTHCRVNSNQQLCKTISAYYMRHGWLSCIWCADTCRSVELQAKLGIIGLNVTLSFFMFAVYKMHFQNGTQGPLDNFMIQFNKNSFGLAPGSQNVPVPQLGPGSSQTAVLPLVQNPALVSPTAASSLLQVCAAFSIHLDLCCHT